MTAKLLKHPGIKFFATSARLADAYRHAARRNKKLGRSSTIKEIGRPTAARQSHENQIVVLSHAEEDCHALNSQSMEKIVSQAFHFLFTEPATHPDQVAQWMRASRIHSENRLHVVRVENLEAPQIAELLGRVCSAFGPDNAGGGIIDGYLVGQTLLVRGPKHRMLHVPVSSIASLRNQPSAVLHNFRIDPDGSFIHWPDLDVHLGWNQFLQAVDPAEVRKAQQRSADFNRRYGAAIRSLREKADLTQSQIPGLTARQLRRIENGTCRATASALDSLAKAHGLEINAYMERVAEMMG